MPISRLFLLSLLPSLACSSLPARNAEQVIKPGLPVFFDLTASIVDSADVMDSLKRRGFNVDPEPAFHPRQHHCRFVFIPKPNVQAMILEVCHIDPALPKDDYKEQVPTPGIEWNLTVDGNLQTYVEKEQSKWTAFAPELTHKNYEWATNSKDRLPGWNFLEFGKAPIPGINLAFNEREPNAKSKNVDHAKRQLYYSLRYHPNAVKVFLGALMMAKDPTEREAFERISQAQRRGDCSYMPDGTWIQWLKPDAPLAQNFKDKRFPIRALVMGTNSMEKFAEAAKPDGTMDLNGRPAAHLRLVPDAWDILVVKATTMEDMMPPAAPCGSK